MINILIDIAKNEIGPIEDASMHTLGSKVEKYQRSTLLHPGSWSWSSAFISWILKEWINIPEVREYLKLETAADLGFWTSFRSTHPYGWLEWASENKILIIYSNNKALAKKGDIVLYKFPHAGLVIEDQKTIKTYLQTIEGNILNTSIKDTVDNDGVWNENRTSSLAYAYIRIIP